MHRRQPLPNTWLMTDERLGTALIDVVRRLPPGSGIVFRHYSLAPAERRRLFAQIRTIARRNRLVLLLAGPPQTAAVWGADGSHGWHGGKASVPHLLRSMAVHDLRQLAQARRCGADLAFVSPVFPTRSHPDAKLLGPLGLGRIASRATMKVIAMGGMDERRARRLDAFGLYGWAGIDAFA